MTVKDISRRKVMGMTSAAVVGGSLYGTTTVAASHTCDECTDCPCRAADEPADCTDACDAYITFNDQEATGGREVVVKEACLPNGGFIDIHDEEDTDACVNESFSAGYPLAASIYLEPGVHKNVELCLCEDNRDVGGMFGECIGWERGENEDCLKSDPRTLCAMLHVDDPDDCCNTHYCNHEEGDDAAYVCDSSPVQDCASVTKNDEAHDCDPIECETPGL